MMETRKQQVLYTLGWVFVAFNLIATIWIMSIEDEQIRQPLLLLALILPAILITVIIHEVGHLVAGILVGFRFQYMSLGPITITRGRRRLYLKLRKTPVIGFVKFTPEDTHNLRRRLQILYISGAAAAGFGSLIFLLIFFSFLDMNSSNPFLMTGDQPWHSVLLPLSFWLMIGLFGCGFILPMVPRKVQGMPSDGLQIDNLRTLSEQEFDVYAARAVLSGTSRRPRDWNSDLLAKLATDDSTPAAQLSNAVFQYFKHLDCSNIPEADHYEVEMLKAARQLDEAASEVFLLEAAYFEVRWRGNLVIAQRYIRRVGIDSLKKSTNRALAAVLIAEGEVEKANQYIEDGIKRLECEPYTGLIEFELDHLLELRAVYAAAN